MAKGKEECLEALKELLMRRKESTQEDICIALEKQGYVVNQTKISRLLRKIGAIKVVSPQGEVIYSLPREPSPPRLSTPLSELILRIVANEVMVVIFTSPGSASLVARLLDYEQESLGILGTLAGDDTIFVTPCSIKDMKKVVQGIKNFFSL